MEEVAKILFACKAVSFRFDPPFTFTTGMIAPIYIDNRVVMTYPKLRRKLILYHIENIIRNIGFQNVDYISATATSAINLGAWISDILDVPMVYARPSKKKHGKQNQVEGRVKKGAKVLIVEDHISTGGSAINNALAIRALGGVVDYCVSTTDYETTVSKRNFKDTKISLFALTNGDKIVEIAKKEGIITKKQKSIVDEWFENPISWGRKHGHSA